MKNIIIILPREKVFAFFTMLVGGTIHKSVNKNEVKNQYHLPRCWPQLRLYCRFELSMDRRNLLAAWYIVRVYKISFTHRRKCSLKNRRSCTWREREVEKWRWKKVEVWPKKLHTKYYLTRNVQQQLKKIQFCWTHTKYLAKSKIYSVVFIFKVHLFYKFLLMFLCQ